MHRIHPVPTRVLEERIATNAPWNEARAFCIDEVAFLVDCDDAAWLSFSACAACVEARCATERQPNEARDPEAHVRRAPRSPLDVHRSKQ